MFVLLVLVLVLIFLLVVALLLLLGLWQVLVLLWRTVSCAAQDLPVCWLQG
jgi:hypothetical protein